MNRPLSRVGTAPSAACVAASPEEGTASRQRLTEERPAARLLRVLPDPAAGASMVVPGARVAYWSDALLELVLRYLGAADLARCGQTCRRWYQAASDPRLKTRALYTNLSTVVQGVARCRPCARWLVALV